MADHPILFSAPMVRAIIREIEHRGTGKTQTRRLIEPYEVALHPFEAKKAAPKNLIQLRVPARLGGFIAGPLFNPRHAVGDSLYVREHWRTTHVLDGIPPRDLRKSENEVVDYTPIFFIADEATQSFNPLIDPPFGKHRQAMHMPRWASRITLIVEGVKVERLQDISEEDAIAEGVDLERYVPVSDSAGLHSSGEAEPTDPIEEYRDLWNSINGPGAWDANPWVAAYTFRPILGNIDKIGGADG